jgi:hypothetical protein
MENLSESVYECTLGVEAHMICDLLARAGISARVDGEFLAGAGGELPLGNTVRVRVDPARAVEAREVIADWEKLQPAEAPTPVVRAPRAVAQLWFLIGAVAGGTLVFMVLNTPYRSDGLDYDGDGVNEVTWHYAGSRPTLTELDRNGDRNADVRWKFDMHGYESALENDDDFDGRFEWQGELDKGQPSRLVLDVDGDERPEQVRYFKDGVLARIEYNYASGGRVVKREFYTTGLLSSAEFDEDRDGVFERHVRYDRFGEPEL